MTAANRTEPSQPRTAAALAARRDTTNAALDRVRRAIDGLRHDRTPVTVAAVARRAAVSRTFLYTNPDAKTITAQAIQQHQQKVGERVRGNDTRQEQGWRDRALNAEDALKATNSEILGQRARIGDLYGRIRDLEADWTQQDVQHVTTENTNLKQRVHQLTANNRTLDERLTAARSNLRFQDRRIADLEAKIAAPIGAASPAPAPPGTPDDILVELHSLDVPNM